MGILGFPLLGKFSQFGGLAFQHKFSFLNEKFSSGSEFGIKGGKIWHFKGFTPYLGGYSGGARGIGLLEEQFWKFPKKENIFQPGGVIF